MSRLEMLVCALTPSSQELQSQSLINLVYSICKVRRQEIVNFMTPYPKGRYFGVKSVNLMYFFKNLLLYSQALIRQTKYVVMITKEGFTIMINFLTPQAGVLVLGHGHMSHVVKIQYFF